MTTTIVGLRELREHTEKYIGRVRRGESFIVARHSRPIFRITPADENDSLWESVIDFTKLKKGGVPLAEVLARL